MKKTELKKENPTVFTHEIKNSSFKIGRGGYRYDFKNGESVEKPCTYYEIEDENGHNKVEIMVKKKPENMSEYDSWEGRRVNITVIITKTH